MSKKISIGLENLLKSKSLRKHLHKKRIALIGHPASVSRDLTHSLDALIACKDLKITAAFGPQHGMKGDKQDNMIESDDYVDPKYKIPIFSLYGQVRRPTQKMMDTFDVAVFDLQDVGCRIYTFIATLLYVMEECARTGKSVWVLDRPNPAGRPVEGLKLRKGFESFVGPAEIPMRHGLTVGELANFYKKTFKLDVDLKVIPMGGYKINAGPGFGWPIGELPWVNPSPNAATLSMARAYPGTVMVEGTTLSEGRGTTHPLEILGAPDLDFDEILKFSKKFAPKWLEGCRLRTLYFEPTFQKHIGKLCHGVQFHCDDAAYKHNSFKPFRAVTLFFKAIRMLKPDYPLWRDFEYEYTKGHLPIDFLNGGPILREWIDDPASKPGDLEALMKKDEAAWTKERRPFLLYK